MICFDNPLRFDDCLLHVVGIGDTNVQEINELCRAKYHKLIMVTSGKMRISSSESSVELSKGEIYLSFPFDTNVFEGAGDEPFSYGCIGFSVNSKRFGDSFNKIWSENVSNLKRVFVNEDVYGAISSIYYEVQNKPEAFSKELVSLLCAQLLIHVVRAFDSVNDSDSSANSGNVGLCELVMNYIDSHLYEIKSLADMSVKFGYNYSYLSTTFHKITHTTLNNYYKSKRMDAARVLLTEEKLSISKVAERLNYSSVYAFSKAFKEFYGISPGHYSGRYENK